MQTIKNERCKAVWCFASLACRFAANAMAYLVFAMNFVRHGQLLAALCAAGSQYAASVGRLHALTETMFVVSFAVVGLECSFHFVYAVLFCFLAVRAEVSGVLSRLLAAVSS